MDLKERQEGLEALAQHLDRVLDEKASSKRQASTFTWQPLRIALNLSFIDPALKNGNFPDPGHACASDGEVVTVLDIGGTQRYSHCDYTLNLHPKQRKPVKLRCHWTFQEV